MLWLMAVTMCAQAGQDPVPEEYRKYFAQQDAEFEKIIAARQADLEKLRFQWEGEPIPKRKAVLETQLKKARRFMDELERLRYQPKQPEFRLPARGVDARKVGQIGLLPDCKLKVVLDGVAVMETSGLYSARIVLVDVDPKSVHLVKSFHSKDLWMITAVDTEDGELKRRLVSGFYFAKSLDAKEVDKYRQQYYAEKKAEAADNAAAVKPSGVTSSSGKPESK